MGGVIIPRWPTNSCAPRILPIDTVLALWAGARTPHAVTPDRREAVEGLVGDGSLLVAESGGEIVGALSPPGATALVPYEDQPARGLWESAGYAHDREVHRFVTNL